MEPWKIFFVVSSVVLLAILLGLLEYYCQTGVFERLFYFVFPGLKRRKMEKKLIADLEHRVRITFGVELGTIHERVIDQDTVVRIVNYLAQLAAKACTEQDKAHRGENMGTPKLYFKDFDLPVDFNQGASWDEVVHALKVAWSEARKLANQIAPELLDRMPYFSEFEPLRGYNLQKPVRRDPLKWPTDKNKK